MFSWALIFAVIAMVSGILGYTGIAAGTATIAKALFIIVLVLVVVFFVLGLATDRSAHDLND